jgi:hypothetical protein
VEDYAILSFYDDETVAVVKRKAQDVSYLMGIPIIIDNVFLNWTRVRIDLPHSLVCRKR